MLKIFKKRTSKKLREKLADTDAKLALVKVELAAKMIQLSGQTNDLKPLSKAEESLDAARKFYGFGNAPVEITLVQVALGDMLFKLGREKSDKSALSRARDAFRTAVTLASLHGDDELRGELRGKIKMIESLNGKREATPSLFKVA